MAFSADRCPVAGIVVSRRCCVRRSRAPLIGDDAFALLAAPPAVPARFSFTFAAYLGTIIDGGRHAWLGGLWCLLAIFLPAWMLIGGALPFWHLLRGKAWTQAALRGANAAVVGVASAQAGAHNWYGKKRLRTRATWRLCSALLRSSKCGACRPGSSFCYVRRLDNGSRELADVGYIDVEIPELQATGVAPNRGRFRLIQGLTSRRTHARGKRQTWGVLAALTAFRPPLWSRGKYRRWLPRRSPIFLIYP